MIRWSHSDELSEPVEPSPRDWVLCRSGVIGKVIPRPGERDELIECLLAAAHLAQRAHGCYLYLVSRSEEHSEEIWIVEAWRSKAYQEAWLARPEVRELIDETRELIASVSEPIMTVPVGGKGLVPRRTGCNAS